MYLIAWILVGAVVGWGAGRVFQGNGYGPFMDILMGVGGAVVPKSGVKFAVFEQICPKNGICAGNLCSSPWIFVQSNFSPPAVLCYELDAISSLSRFR